MIYALLLILVFLVLGGYLYIKAKPKAKPDIILFGSFAVFCVLAAGIVSEVSASELQPYVGAEFGLDWPHNSESKSPQCLDHGQLTSDGRLFAGVEAKRGIVVFYSELDAWRHKSCALQEDDQVYDAFGFKFGFKIEL